MACELLRPPHPQPYVHCGCEDRASFAVVPALALSDDGSRAAHEAAPGATHVDAVATLKAFHEKPSLTVCRHPWKQKGTWEILICCCRRNDFFITDCLYV